MCHTVCARIVSREDPFVVWSLKHLERMALATVWSVGRMGPEERNHQTVWGGGGGFGNIEKKDQCPRCPLRVRNKGVEKPERCLQHVWAKGAGGGYLLSQEPRRNCICLVTCSTTFQSRSVEQK